MQLRKTSKQKQNQGRCGGSTREKSSGKKKKSGRGSRGADARRQTKNW